MLKLLRWSPLALLFASPAVFAAQSRMPDFNIRDIIWNILILLGVAVIFGLIDYLVGKAPFISEPIKSFIHWALIVAACLILIFIILSFLGL